MSGRYLLDTNILISLADGDVKKLGKPMLALLASEEGEHFLSVASLWEMAIKHRLGKLALPFPIADVESVVPAMGLTLLPVVAAHAIADVEPWPETNDPFDRMLLAICRVEGLRLLTIDHRLAGHTLAWRPATA